MHFLEIEDRRYAQFDRLRHEAGLVHAFSTRPANAAPGSGPDEAVRAERRRRMAEDFGLDAARLRYCQQVHAGDLTVVDTPTPAGPLAGCDGVVTVLPGVPVMTFSADCALVLAYDPVRRVVGMAHASWRCTVAHVTSRLIGLMAARCGCQPADMRAGIGPGAGPCCYEVQDDVYQAAATLTDRDRFFLRRGKRMYFDLWEANRAQLLEAGLSAENIESADVCTMCRKDVFYSFRREGAGCGHFGLMAGIPRG